MIHVLCRLKPKGPLHLGEMEGMLEQSASHIPSDTLFSALCCSWRLLFGKASLQKLLRGFTAGKAPFIFSSAFPYLGQELYFPVPRHFPAKGRRWLPKARFEDALDGRLTQSDASAGSGGLDLEGWLSDASRLGRGRAFSIARVNPPREAGYFFLARFTEEKTRKDFDAALRLLADEGIGGDRSSGCGFFHPPSWEEASFGSPGTYADARCLLSMFYPKDDAEAGRLAGGYYGLQERRGRIQSPDKGRGLLWRPVRLAEEGSLVEGASEIAGQVVDVTPDDFKAHHIYRCGLAYSLACVSRIPAEAAA